MAKQWTQEERLKAVAIVAENSLEEARTKSVHEMALVLVEALDVIRVVSNMRPKFLNDNLHKLTRFGVEVEGEG